MFGKTLSIANICTVLAMCSTLGMTAAMPVRRATSENDVFGRDLVPLTPVSRIEPEMVDLLDQYRNLAELAAGAKGTPEFDAVEAKLEETKVELEAKIQGVATFVTEPVSTPTTTVEASTSATSSATFVTSAASTASSTPTPSSTPSTTTAAPTGTINTKIPVLTIVTQVGTSVVVVASQGVTSTITLATRTAISSSATGGASASSTSPRSTSTFDINTAAAPGTAPTTSSAPGTAVNSSQNNIHSGAASFVPSMWSGSMWIAGLTMGTLIAL